jgi:hypothetical protein
MEVQGIIKSIKETKTFGASGFRKRELHITTNEQYPQVLLIEFVQDKVDLLDKFKEGQNVEIGINLRGREWTNPEGEVVVFNTIQGWKINTLQVKEVPPLAPVGNDLTEAPDDLPF